jgi:hypothetical protein
MLAVSAVFPLLVSAALGQAPAAGGEALLRAVPAEAEVVLHVKGMNSTRDELVAMLRALSPNLAEQAEPTINQGLEHMAQRFGEPATKSPFVFAMRLPDPMADNPQPAFAVIVPTDNYQGILQSLAGEGNDAKPEAQPGGYDKISAQGEEFYATKGDGWVAFGQGKDDLIKAIAARPAQTITATLSADLQKALLGGDAGVYVNLAAVQTRYADQIEEGKKSFMALLDQAAAQMQGGQIEQVKELYGQLFESVKQAEGLALNVDFDAKALGLSGLVTVKAGSPAAATLQRAQTGTAAMLANLPADSLMYMYMNIDPSSMAGLMRMNMANFANLPGVQNQDKAALEKSIEAAKAAGRQESYASVRFDGGMKIVSLSIPEHPDKALEVASESMQAMKGGGIFKEAKVEKDALEYKGFKFNKATITFDIDKMVEQQGGGNPAAGAMIKQMLGENGTMTTYFGSDGKRIASIVANTPDEVKARLDAVLGGSSGGIGRTPSFAAVRAKLPERANLVVLMNAQELVKTVARLLGGLTGGEMKPPANLPKEPALFGGSLAATPAGYRFDLVVPTTVGPVMEQGFGAIMQAMQGQVNQ